MGAPIMVGDHQMQVGVSVGIAFAPETAPKPINC